MRNRTLFLLLILPLGLFAQQGAADALLDKAIAAMKADAAVQMDYIYTVYDDENDVVQSDKGVMRLDGEKYTLLMDGMKVWCNGSVQWSYVKDVNEIYVTDAASDEAQNLSPLYIMENYRKGCESSLRMQGRQAVVTLEPAQGDIVGSVELFVDCENSRLKAMCIYMPGQGRVEVKLDKYSPSCKFAADSYECPVGEFPGVEIVDMR